MLPPSLKLLFISSNFLSQRYVENNLSFSHFSVNSGSFVYDIDLGLGSREWTPTKEELMVISARMHRIAEESLPLERLVVDLALAKEMFSDSIHKKKQIPSIAKNSPSGIKGHRFHV